MTARPGLPLRPESHPGQMIAHQVGGAEVRGRPQGPRRERAAPASTRLFAEGERLHLPKIGTRLVPQLHPSTREITERGIAWAKRFIPFDSQADRDRFIEQAHCMWTCLLFPAGSRERVQDICDLTLFLFATDDAFVKARASGTRREASELLELAPAVVRGYPVVSRNPWLPGLRDVWGRLRSRMPESQLDRVTRSLDALYEGAAREVVAREAGRWPSFDGYMRLRKDSVGAKIYFVLTEYAIGVDLTYELATSSAIGAVQDAASEHLILTNDLFSFRKERYDGDDFNAVAVIHRQTGSPVQQIVNALCTAIEMRELAFLNRRKDVLASPLGELSNVRSTLRGLGHLLSGNLRWSYMTPRYHGVGHQWDGVTPSEVTLSAKGTKFHG